jgi:hypothetical protein
VNLLTRKQQGGGSAKSHPVRGPASGALLALVMLAGGAVSACDPIFVIRGSVSIPSTLQSSFSSEQRGRLVIVARHQGGGFPHLSWVTLCEPSAAPLVVPFVLQKTGCAQETVVEARLERIVATDPADVPACGSRGQVVSIRDDALVASIERTALVGATGCDSADVEVNLAF